MIILCADDYAMTEGISRAIGELAAAQRLSATSLMVNSPHWPAAAPRLRAHRGHLSIGLHLNLTLGTPVGPMPRLAPAGAFPGLRGVLARAYLGLLDGGEVRAEIERQLDRFEAGLQFPPDHIDGHQHIQVLPRVRGALMKTVQRRYSARPPLLRNPTDAFAAIATRRLAAPKAMSAAALALGFGDAARRRGLPVNDSFAGFSDFDVKVPYADELRSALLQPGRRHLVMCHPGHPDAELAGLDPVVDRRRMEYDVIMRDPDLPQRIWRPSRSADGPAISWLELRD
jgi:chitin disaccharide deacetylase